MQYICNYCNGEGGHYEDNECNKYEMRVFHPCYHCESTGKVSFETIENDRVNAFVSDIAYSLTQKQRLDSIHDETGEGWEFYAAENGMTIREYKSEIEYKNSKFVFDELMKLDKQVLKAILDMHLRITAIRFHEKKPSNDSTSEVGVSVEVDDSPF